MVTAEAKRLRNAGYQARWRARRNALAQANPEVAERALLQAAEGCGRLSEEEERLRLADKLADAAMVRLRRSQELAAIARRVRAGER